MLKTTSDEFNKIFEFQKKMQGDKHYNKKL